MKFQQNQINKQIGTQIKALRKLNKMSQTELGDEIGITYQQIQKYESGANKVSPERFYQLADVFGISVTEFFKDELETGLNPLTLTTEEASLLNSFRNMPEQLRKPTVKLIQQVGGAN